MLKPDEEVLRQRNKDSAEKSSFFWVESTNKSESEINLQLLTLTGILLPLSAGLLALPTMSFAGKIALLLAWIFLILSILLGFIHLTFGTHLFSKYLSYSLELTRIWSKARKTFSEYEDRASKVPVPPSKTPFSTLIAQAITAFIALLFIFLCVSTLLFSTNQRNDDQAHKHCEVQYQSTLSHKCSHVNDFSHKTRKTICYNCHTSEEYSEGVETRIHRTLPPFTRMAW